MFVVGTRAEEGLDDKEYPTLGGEMKI